MASFGHVAVGLALGRLGAGGAPPGRVAAWMLGLSVLSLLPDADALSFKLGIAYAAEWGHRGASHSLALAAGVALAVAAVTRLSRGPALKAGLLSLAAMGSHGLLDAMTTGGLGAALLWPFTQARYFFPWRPIPVAPIGLGMLSARGLYVVQAELLLFLPFWLYALWPRRRASRPLED
ncbi:metal-dependent hydrolase [Vitiosangium sp. GDMCC 1.1324]|uniref:metal-dependent hydrolase n=1 Tax=Vitiosangium sp. (strain GDMCC 1.1324) TaxID=2138576 RepID=UPI000D39F417|nr:metal-dependent hydrolase [Vitiosangium sp. GDMCC 1.1324]PTL82894.1 metal-dependent hydrolase [Vitiosangium sp. GDMCC 1.1324]